MDSLVFEDKNGRHQIYFKSYVAKLLTEEIKNSFYSKVYFEIFRWSLFCKDSELNNFDDKIINILSAQTLISKGLKVLKK